MTSAASRCPNAKVRLAVGSAAGGKVVSATTDRSGAFTLHGLRPGSSYTVIAEYQGDDGIDVRPGASQGTAGRHAHRSSAPRRRFQCRAHVDSPGQAEGRADLERGAGGR